jgi:hypothetical protein
VKKKRIMCCHPSDVLLSFIYLNHVKSKQLFSLENKHIERYRKGKGACGASQSKKKMGAMYSRAHLMTPISMDELDRGGIAETGDILLFQGRSAFGLFEECMTKSPYSHVAMFVRNPETGVLYVWESSNADNNVDVLTKKKKDGPRLIPARIKIEEYLLIYGDAIIYRKLVRPPGTRAFSREQWPELLMFLHGESHKHFEKWLFTMPESYTHRLLYPRREDLSSVFCSEEVANTWKFSGVPLYRRPDMYCPQDFSEELEDLFNYEEEPVRTRGWGMGPPMNIVIKRKTVKVYR